MDNALLGIDLYFWNGNILTGYFSSTEAFTMGSAEELTDSIVTSGNLSALAVDVDSVSIIKIDAEEVVLVSGLATCPPTKTDCRDGRPSDEPIGDIEVVDVLFDDVIARELGEVEPISSKVFVVRPGSLTAINPWNRSVPRNGSADDFPNRAVFDLSGVAQIFEFVAPLGSGYDGQALLLRGLANGDKISATGRVNRSSVRTTRC